MSNGVRRPKTGPAGGRASSTLLIGAEEHERDEPTSYTPEQTVGKLREADRLLGEDAELLEVTKQLEVSEATITGSGQYGGTTADDVKRLKELEVENAGLKRIVADEELEILALKEIARGNWWARCGGPRRVVMLQDRLDISERRACRIVGQRRSTQRYAGAGGRR